MRPLFYELYHSLRQTLKVSHVNEFFCVHVCILQLKNNKQVLEIGRSTR